uniref:Uncharacterized protein n=1 Tax=Amphiprion percula TaxID=161767 RepID=A0A3P8TW75_AMPPE
MNAYLDLHVGHEHCKAGEVGAGAAGVCAIGSQQTTVLRCTLLTCRCLTVKTTGSDRYTLLLSLLMDAVITGELTITDLTLAFSVDR